MDRDPFDRLARKLTQAGSRRSLVSSVLRSTIAGPVALGGMHFVRADGKNKDTKDKDKDRNRGQSSGPVVVNAPGGTAAATTEQPAAPPAAQTTTVQTSNQVCAGDCAQTSQQALAPTVNQAVLPGSLDASVRPPTYWLDLSCVFDAPAYRTTCTGTTHSPAGAPLVQKITLPTERFCAVVLDTTSQPEKRETVRRPAPAVAGGGQANAGNGGVANASANGGSVSVGDIGGGQNTNVSINASGGTANADASGGNNNVAIAGAGQAGQELEEQVVTPSTLTVTLEGQVVPGKTTTYWLDTEAGRRPAAGPTLLQVADQTTQTGTILVDAWTCPTSPPDAAYDWFGQCTTPASGMQFGLYPASGGSAPLATGTPDAQGQVRFANLAPGTYQVRPEGAPWCHAESDHVDADGNVQVEAQTDSHVWSFVCGAPAGS
jgi:hypothetical protein